MIVDRRDELAVSPPEELLTETIAPALEVARVRESEGGLCDALIRRFGDLVAYEASQRRGAPAGFEGTITVAREHLLPVLDHLGRTFGGALELADVTAVDELARGTDRDDSRFTLLHRIRRRGAELEIELRTSVPAFDTSAPSTTGLFPGASILEREVYDLFGIDFDGHAELRRLFLPESFPDLPLSWNDRKGARASGRTRSAGEPNRKLEGASAELLRTAERTGSVIVDVGPDHPMTRGALRLILAVGLGPSRHGRVIASEVEIGFAHRGVERAAESLDWFGTDHLFDTVPPAEAAPSRHAIALAIEALADLDVPPRGEVLRARSGELARIAEHARLLARTADALGTDAATIAALDDARRFALAELVRFRPAIGGVIEEGRPRNAAPNVFPAVLRRRFERASRRLLRAGRLRLSRLAGIGVKDAIAFGLSGPLLRATGLAADVRRDRPYDTYFHSRYARVPTEESGSALARLRVLVQETTESFRLLEAFARDVPGGPERTPEEEIAPRLDAVLPGEEAEAAVEAPGGELRVRIVAGSEGRPARLRLRPPGLATTGALPFLLRGCAYEDAEVIIAGLALPPAELDR